MNKQKSLDEYVYFGYFFVLPLIWQNMVFSAPDTVNTNARLQTYIYIYILTWIAYMPKLYILLWKQAPTLHLTSGLKTLICIWMDKKTVDDKGVVLNLSIWYENDKQRRARACAKTWPAEGHLRSSNELSVNISHPVTIYRNSCSTWQACIRWRDWEKLRWNSGWSGFGMESNPYTQERNEAKLLSANLVQSMPDNGWQS